MKRKTLVIAASAFAAAALWAADERTTPPGIDDTPELFKGVTLTDESGAPEQGLVDPFRRRSADEGVEGGERAEDGLMRTTMGEISSEFKILAITIPENGVNGRCALIQFYDSDEPILVHEGDLVRVDRQGAGNVRGGRRRSARAQRSAPQSQELEEELRKFVFYVNVKHIEPTYIEVYHNKKRPDETIRLNW